MRSHPPRSPASLAALALAAALALGGCSSADDAAETPGAGSIDVADIAALESTAQTMVEDLAAGDGSTIYAAASDQVTQQISEADLVEAWDQTVVGLGAYQSVRDTASQTEQDYVVVDVVADFAQGTVTTTLTFGPDGALEGVWFAPGEGSLAEPVAPHVELPDGAVEVGVEVGEFALPGAITVPSEDAREGAPEAVVLLVAGSGPADMDQTIGASENATLRDLAFQLAGEGIASLRYDKRFFADPESATESSTIHEEVLDDVASAVELLGTHEDTAGLPVVVIGHSLGGMLVPAIVTDNAGVEGAVIMAGTPRTLWDLIRDQNELALSQSGASESEIAEQMIVVDAEIDRANALTDPSEPTILGSVPAPYVVSMNELNLAETARGLDVPLLVLQGDADFQVSAEADFKAWADVLSDVPDVTFELFPGLNHLFMSTTGASGISDYDPENAVAPEVSETIVEWMRARW